MADRSITVFFEYDSDTSDVNISVYLADVELYNKDSHITDLASVIEDIGKRLYDAGYRDAQMEMRLAMGMVC